MLSLQGPGGLPQVHDGKASPAAAPQAHKPSWPHRPLWVTLVNEGDRDAEWKSKRLSEGLMGNAGGSGGRRVVLMGKTWKNEAGREGREMGRVAGGTALSGGEPGSWPSDSSCLELILGFSEDVHLITLK